MTDPKIKKGWEKLWKILLGCTPAEYRRKRWEAHKRATDPFYPSIASMQARSSESNYPPGFNTQYLD